MSTRSFVVLLLLMLGPRQAAAQLDSDPTNDAAAGANALSLAVGGAISNRAAFAAPDNDVDFFSVSLSANDVLFGMATTILPVNYRQATTSAPCFASAPPRLAPITSE